MSNKKKLILIGVGVIILISLLSNIGGNSDSTPQEPREELILKAAQTEIKGDLKGCYEIVDKNYKVNILLSVLIIYIIIRNKTINVINIFIGSLVRNKTQQKMYNKFHK